jgi:beta-glucosidase
MGVAAVLGFQATRPVADDRVLATLKHMTGHGQPESGTNIGPADMGERTLRDIFLYPFEMAVAAAEPAAVMASYNEIDGVPSHVNRWMLHDVLRGEWGFDGVVVSDWFAVDELISRHQVAGDQATAARRALDATVDIELPDASAYPTLIAQVQDGTVPEAAVDAAVRRLLRATLELGLFEDPFVDPDRAVRTAGAEEHRAVALEAARKALVLLKNEGRLLPVSPDGYERIAVIGPHAGEVLLGRYSGVPRYGVSILEGIRGRVGPAVRVDYAEGVRITEGSVFTDQPQPHMGGFRSHLRWNTDAVALADSASNAGRRAEAVGLAAASDLAILVLGDNVMTSREAWAEAHLGDRARLDLTGPQEALVDAVVATGTPTVLVLQNGRPTAIPGVAGQVPAILEAWYAGQEAGTAVAEALFGDLNPGGKLPVTFPRSVGQLPIFYDHKPSARRGYLFGTTEPLFPFGYGLSSTRFEMSEPRLSAAQIAADGQVAVDVDVANVGDVRGDEVVQLYVRDELSEVTRPLLQLRGFRRVGFDPGETRTVRFELGPGELAYTGLELERVVEPGWFRVCVGPSSTDLECARFEVTGPAHVVGR